MSLSTAVTPAPPKMASFLGAGVAELGVVIALMCAMAAALYWHFTRKANKNTAAGDAM